MRRSAALILLLAVFLIVNLVNAIRKGGDFADYLRAANRFVSGAPLYAGSDVTVGFVGPPVQALLFVPFVPLAHFHELAPRLAWYLLNLALLWYAVRTWVSALCGQRHVRWIEADGTLTAVARDTLLALLAIAFPLQTQFEHQNLNIVLLASTAYAAAAISRGQPSRAGVALGAAAALKVYPLLVAGWLGARRAWRAAGAAIVCSIALTLTPAMFRGASQFSEGLSTFFDLSAEGWPARPANQSVLAMWGRYLFADSPSDDLLVTTAAGGVVLLTLFTLGLVWAPLLWTSLVRRAGVPDAEELACAAAASTLVSPIAWEHYWIAWFPVFFALRRRAREQRLRWAEAAFWMGALLITGLSRPTLGPDGARFVRDLSFSTWGVILTCVVLGILLASRASYHRRVSTATILIIGMLVVLPAHVAAQPPAASGNPVLAGRYADPEAHRFEGQYWIYPTYSARYDEQTFMDAFSSRDLVTWTKHERVLDIANVRWAKRALWAPSIVEKDGWYYLFFGANDIQNDQQVGGIGVARARRPEGPFEDYLGRPLIDRFHNGAQPIDQFVFRDRDGAYYIVYGGWRHCNIARLNADFTGFVPFPDGTVFKEITPKGYVEGAFMLLKDGKYYFMWSEGGWTGPDYAVAYAVGDSPFGPFERVGKILQQDPSVATGAGHHSVLRGASGRWYIVYHRRPLGETDRNHRLVCIDELIFEPDGSIRPVVITNSGVGPDPIR